MHIPDNYLSPQTCAVMGAIMLPVWGIAAAKIRSEVTPAKMPLVGIAAAFTFLVMMFNVPVPGGTTAHAICATLVAVLFGPFTAILAVSTALLIQALMFGDGGILAFGANCFNMAFVMPLTGWLIFSALTKIFKGKSAPVISAFIASYISILLAALCNSIELGLQPLLFRNGGHPMYCPYGWNITIPAMLFAHLIAGALDAVLTAGVYSFVTRLYPDYLLKDPPKFNASGKRVNSVPLIVFLAILAVLTPIGLMASGDAFGEWSPADLQTDAAANYKINFVPKGMQNGFHYTAPLDNYGASVSILNSKRLPHPFSRGDSLDPNVIAGYLISAIAGAAILMILYKIISEIVRRRKGAPVEKA